MTSATLPLQLRSRYMTAALRLNAAAQAGPTGMQSPDALRWNLQALVQDMRGVEDLGQLPALAQSALVCAAAMSKPYSPVVVPLLSDAPVTPYALLATLSPAQVLLLSPRTAYNLACALAFLDQGAQTGLSRLLTRALDQPGVAESAREDPFFKHVKDADWFVELLGPDPKSELASTWLTAHYAKALAPTKDLSGLRERLRTDTGLAGVLHVSSARLQEWADLLAVQGVPMSSLELLDRLAVRSPEDLAAQDPTALHLALKALGGTQKHDDVVTWVRTAQPLSERT